MKTILVMVHDDAGQESRLQCALDVVRATEGRLVCLNLMRLPMVVDAMMMPATVEIDNKAREDALVARTDQRLAAEGVPHEWLRAQGDFDRVIAENARLVDLIVVSDGSVDSLGDQSDLGGRIASLVSVPILVVPRDQDRLDLFGTAVVAWDGKAAADAAIRAAVPLLKLAARVVVVTIGDNALGDAEQAARYLASHGCNAEARPLARVDMVADQLAEVMRAANASLAVMGSYGHGRMREMLFGGTTRSLLAGAPVPLIVAH